MYSRVGDTDLFVLSVLLRCSEFTQLHIYIYTPVSFRVLSVAKVTTSTSNYLITVMHSIPASREQACKVFRHIQPAAIQLASLEQGLPFAFVCAWTFTFCACNSKDLVLSLWQQH